MPTFREKCPEFGQKVRIKGSEGEFMVFIGERKGDYNLASKNYGVNGYGPLWEWEAETEEPQWTQITEDESTWPPEHILVVIDGYCGFRDGEMISAKGLNDKSSYYKIKQIYGAHWIHLPQRKRPCGEKRPCGGCFSTEYAIACWIDDGPGAYCNLCVKKKEEKPYISDESKRKCKKCGGDGNIFGFNLIIDEVCRDCRLTHAYDILHPAIGPVSPWKSTRNPPEHPCLVMIKLDNGHISGPFSFKYSDEKYSRLDSSFCMAKYWMEIQK